MGKAVYIVVKHCPVKTEVGVIDFLTNQAVFDSELSANAYIVHRKSEHDRDDRGCHFTVEPWRVQS